MKNKEGDLGQEAISVLIRVTQVFQQDTKGDRKGNNSSFWPGIEVLDLQVSREISIGYLRLKGPNTLIERPAWSIQRDFLGAAVHSFPSLRPQGTLKPVLNGVGGDPLLRL